MDLLEPTIYDVCAWQESDLMKRGSSVILAKPRKKKEKTNQQENRFRKTAKLGHPLKLVDT